MGRGPRPVYQHTGKLHPPKSLFNLSHRNVGSVDIGMLVPVMLTPAIAGDVFKLGIECVIRANPLVHPTMHELNAHFYTFFVPYRLLDENFEENYTGGQYGGIKNEQGVPNGIAIGDEHFPKWAEEDPDKDPLPLNVWQDTRVWVNSLNNTPINLGNLWDYFGFGGISTAANVASLAKYPELHLSAYPLRAYNFIYNEYFRDENLENEIEAPYDLQDVIDADKDDDGPGFSGYSWMVSQQKNVGVTQGSQGTTGVNIWLGNWEKDLFTIALPFQQRGPSPALPIYGNIPADDINALLNEINLGVTGTIPAQQVRSISNNGAINIPSRVFVGVNSAGTQVTGGYELGNGYQDPQTSPAASGGGPATGQPLMGGLYTQMDANFFSNASMSIPPNYPGLSLGNATAGDVNDLRWAFQTQKFLERNARIGYRYVEQLPGRYGVAKLDVRLDRPEYIGGTKSPILISEVLQTSESGNTSQGNMAGHGITADSTFIGSYRVQEHGLIMTLMCIKPRSVYRDGLPREFCFDSRLDIPAPEFVNMSERAVKNYQLFLERPQGTPTDNEDGVFGYQGMYDEYRTILSKTSGLMRKDFETWNLTRSFENTPTLSYQFIKISPKENARISAVTNEHGFIYTIGNRISCARILPIIAEPGLIDHH